MKKILLLAAIVATNSAQAQLDYEDSMTGATIDSAWNVNVTTVAVLDDPNDQIDYNHVQGTTRRFLSDQNGFVSKTMYFKASISNFTGASVVFIGFVEDGPANNANYASTVVSGNHTYEMFFNNTLETLPFDNGAGWTGTLGAGEGLWTIDGGSSSAALTVGGAVDADKAMSGFGFANFGNELTFPSASFSIDYAAAHLSMILPGAGNIPPTATITAPSDGTSVAEGANINFTGTATDTEDGNLDGSIQWSSNLDGSIGSGASINVSNLQDGIHTITASVTDSGSLVGTDDITVTVNANLPPIVTVTAPADGSTANLGDSVNFTGTAIDSEDGSLSSSLSWSSSINGSLGSGASINTSSLTVGVHTVTASVTDSGSLVGSNSISVTVVDPANSTPTVMVTAPTNGTTVDHGISINFTATANDTEDGDLGSDIEWTSSINGSIGIGTNINVSSLSGGTHTITASATDSGFKTGSDAISVTVNPPAALRPNIIVIVSDDAGYADFGFMNGPGLSGETSEVPTPNLDALANRGITFSRAYVAANCQPTRAAMVTGAYQARIGNENVGNNHFLSSQIFEGIPVEVDTIWDRMKAEGYSTGAIGKWHLGSIEDQPGIPGNRPQNQGIDEFYGFWHGSRNYLMQSYGNNSSPTSPLQLRYVREAINHPNGTTTDEVVEFTKFSPTDYMTNVLGNYAEQFVDDHHDDAEPFFLYVAHPAPHKPWTNESPDYNDPAITGLSTARRQVASMMITMDKEIGDLMAKLDDPLGDGTEPGFNSDSITDNTLVIFINDNGGVSGGGTDNGQLNGVKGSPHDGGICVPMIIAGAGVDPSVIDTVYNHPVHGIDILPTSVALAGGTWDPVADNIDGVNLMPFINGIDTSAPHDILAHRWRGTFSIIDDNWKLVNTHNADAGPERFRLYDLDTDRGESNDISGNAIHASRIAAMKRELTNHEAVWDKPRYPILARSLETEPLNIIDHFTFRPGLHDDWSAGVPDTVAVTTQPANWYEGGTTNPENMFRSDGFNGAILEFPVHSSDYTANNDLRRKTGMTFMLNKIILSGDFTSGADRTATISGNDPGGLGNPEDDDYTNELLFTNDLAGNGPQITNDAIESGGFGFTYNVSLNLIMYDDLSISGDGDADLVITGELSQYFESRGLNKTGTSTASVNGARSYSGDTTIAGGILTLGAANPNDNDSSFFIALGGTANLTFGGTDTVDKLFIGGVQQAAGVYEAIGNPGSGIEIAQITGSGTLTVSSGTTSTGYMLWSDLYAPGQAMTEDHDFDEVQNGIEYFMGETGNSFTVLPIPDQSGNIVWPMGSSYIGSYESGYRIETSFNLIDWTEVGVEDVTVNPATSVSYDLPTGETSIFVRLAVNPE